MNLEQDMLEKGATAICVPSAHVWRTLTRSGAEAGMADSSVISAHGAISGVGLWLRFPEPSVPWIYPIF